MSGFRKKINIRKTVCALGSIFIHLLLLLILSFSDLGIKDNQLKDKINFDAITIANLAPSAKDKRSTKGETQKGEKVKKKTKSPLRKRAQNTPRKKTKLAKITPRKKSARVDKKIAYNKIKQPNIIKTNTYKSQYNMDKRSVVKKQINIKINSPKQAANQETAKLLQKITKTQKISIPKDSLRLETPKWQPNNLLSKADKQVKPVKSIAKQTNLKKQLQYESPGKTPSSKVVSNRLTYKEKTQKNTPRAIKTLKVQTNKPIEPLKPNKAVTKYRKLTKTAKLSAESIQMDIPKIQNNLAIEKIPFKGELKKENKPFNANQQRVAAATKQIEYKEKINYNNSVLVSKSKVTYQPQNTDTVKKAIASAANLVTELTPTMPQQVFASISPGKLVKQKVNNYSTASYTSPVSFTQNHSNISGNPERAMEKVTNKINIVQPRRNKNAPQVKFNVQQNLSSQVELAAFSKTDNPESAYDSSSIVRPGSSTSTQESDIKIDVDLPASNMTNKQLYKVSGSIDSDAKVAFLTINEVTQLIALQNNTFEAEVAMAEGINDFNIMAFNSKGHMGKKSFQILFNAPRGSVPVIKLDSPVNGRQGVTQGERILVKGRIDDVNITKAILLLNKTPIPLEVKNGRFNKKISLPQGKIFVFRIMAKNRQGNRGFSPAHTVLSSYDIDILNPRPY